MARQNSYIFTQAYILQVLAGCQRSCAPFSAVWLRDYVGTDDKEPKSFEQDSEELYSLNGFSVADYASGRLSHNVVDPPELRRFRIKAVSRFRK
jgi:hypothetical protein